MITELNTKVATITYELPLNEAIRLCLRLENLFIQFDQAAHANTSLDTKIAMQSLLHILDVADRPDIKSKLSQMLTQYTNMLNQLTQSSQVNKPRLNNTLEELTQLNRYLHTNYQRLDEALRKNEFLYHIRTNALTPGGITDFRLPDYFLWQQQSREKKSRDLHHWMNNFEYLRKIVNTILTLTRESGNFADTVAENGFYHQSLNASNTYQLARIMLPIDQNLFPEFGAGKHRLTIRFLTPNYYDNGRAKQAKRNIDFQLSCCKL